VKEGGAKGNNKSREGSHLKKEGNLHSPGKGSRPSKKGVNKEVSKEKKKIFPLFEGTPLKERRKNASI